MPPLVFDAEDQPLLSRHHHLSTRQLCLFGPGNARWMAKCTVSHVIGEVKELLLQFGKGGMPPEGDLVPEPLSSVINYGLGESILIPPPISSVQFDADQTGQCEVSLCYESAPNNSGVRRGMVVSALVGGTQTKISNNFEHLKWQKFDRIICKVISFSQQPSIQELETTVVQLAKRTRTSLNKRDLWIAAIFPEQSGSTEQTRFAWVFARVFPGKRPEWIRGFPVRAAERLARIPHLQGIENVNAAIIGCGCLGSKIAVNLAASGVEQFSLLDSDIMEPYNSVRHEVGTTSFGLSKVEALAWRLWEINPEVLSQITPIPCSVGSVNSVEVENKLFEVISRASVVIDTTGVHGVSRWLNDLCSILNVPAIYASVTNGSWGGEIVRSIPGKTPCWLCWYNQFADSRPPAEPADVFFAPGCDQPSFTGTTYDSAIVASFATSMVVDTVLPESEGRKSLNGDYIRWSGRDENGVPILRSEILSVKRRADCPFCGGN